MPIHIRSAAPAVAFASLLAAGTAVGQQICGSWSAMPGPETGGPAGQNAAVYSLTYWDNGTGRALYAGGTFTGATSSIRNVAKWDGAVWQPLGQGISTGRIDVLLGSDGRVPPGLYAAGGPGFGISGGIQRWDGERWLPLGNPFYTPAVTAMAIHDDGDGPALYAAGGFTGTNGFPSGSLILWRGGVWLAVPGAPTGIRALASFDDGTGPALYVGGQFTTAGGVQARAFARLRGSTWSEVGGGVSAGINPATVDSIVERNDGRGPALLLSGFFYLANGSSSVISASWRAGVWDTYPSPGTNYLIVYFPSGQWRAVGLQYASMPITLTGGIIFNFYPANGGPEITGPLLGFTNGRWMETGIPADFGISTMIVDQDTPELARIVVGSTTSTTSPHSTLATWTACTPCYANCDGSAVGPVLNINDFVCFQQRFAAADSRANCDASTDPPILTINDFICFQQKFAAGCS